jgi:hypothetical protein
MRFFASWWERVPTRQINSILAVALVVAIVGVQLGSAVRGTGLRAAFFSQSPVGEVWH